jgi:hypothetical protein
MTTTTTPSSLALVPSLKTAWQDVDSSFERLRSHKRGHAYYVPAG